MFCLYNKIEGFAIVTGGARGLGAAMIEQLALEGYDVVINYVSDHSTPIAKSLADKVKKEHGVGAITFQGNVKEYSNCKAMVEAGVKAFGDKIAVLVNNAGLQHNKLFQDLTPEEYTELISVELLGTMHCTHIVLPYMQAAKNGCIINISSICALYGETRQCDYDAAKAGMIGFCRGLARENAANNVRVNCIAPGLIVTDMVKSLPPEQVEAFRLGIPLQRLGEPKDISQCMSYIVNAPYLTGQVISPNGGSAMY